MKSLYKIGIISFLLLNLPGCSSNSVIPLVDDSKVKFGASQFYPNKFLSPALIFENMDYQISDTQTYQDHVTTIYPGHQFTNQLYVFLVSCQVYNFSAGDIYSCKLYNKLSGQTFVEPSDMDLTKNPKEWRLVKCGLFPAQLNSSDNYDVSCDNLYEQGQKLADKNRKKVK